MSLRQTDDSLHYHVHNDNQDLQLSELMIRDYFQLDINCQRLYTKWKKADPNFASMAASLPGIRVLKQDLVETLMAFICSANNNITRISKMVNQLAAHYGTYLGTYSGTNFYIFPSLLSLANDGVEHKLRELGFGYRAKYIAHAAQYILRSKGVDWLESLKKLEYREVWCELQSVPGVGPKVADCVCLMALGKTEAVPIDTHIWQVTLQSHRHLPRHKSLTRAVYREIGMLFIVCIIHCLFNTIFNYLYVFYKLRVDVEI